MQSKNSLWIIVLSAIVFFGCRHQSSGLLTENNSAAPFTASSSTPKIQTEHSPDKINATIAPDEDSSEPAGIITLRDAVAHALVNSPKLKAFSLDIRAAEARKLQAGFLPNPQIEAQVEEFGGSGDRSGFDSSETGVKIGQLIELADKRSKRTHLADIEKDLAELDFKSERLDVISDVAGAFIDVLAAQEQLSLSKELVDLSEQAYSTVAERVRAGRDSPVEETKAKIALSNTRIEFERAGNNLIAARYQLAATWGSSNPAFDKVSGGFYDTSSSPSFEELTGMISQNPDIARWQAEKERSRAALKLEKAKATSDIKLRGGIQYFDEGDDSAFILGLSIPFPLFDRNQGNIQQATYMLAKTEEQNKAVQADIRARLAEASRKLSSSLNEITVLQNDVLPLAKSAFDATNQGYREGKFEYLAVLDAQRTFFGVRAKYIEALAGYHKARTDVERLIGGTIEKNDQK
ncbi:MAG: TolC family protein [Planctomycetota bacterium]|jgi:cobalt-zinc-cadmium efflux system outer membrane protein